jgi:DNA (cytosine-5)-methyltransferase 1
MAAKVEVRSKRRFCEFFAGIGLVRLGLEHAGWECAYANDNDPKKQQQYEAQFGAAHFHLCDVFNRDEIVARLPSSISLATASFPCIDLSLAGHWKGIEGSHSSAIFGFLNCLSAFASPPLLLLENVVGLLSSKNGKDFEQLVCLLSEAGYWLDAFRLDARFFVPQSRPRIFLVGVHESVISACPFPLSRSEYCLGKDDWETCIRSSAELRPKRLVDLMKNIDLPTGWFCSVSEAPRCKSASLADLIDVDASQLWWDESQVNKHYEMMNDSHRKQVDSYMKEGGIKIGTIYRRKRKGKTWAETRFDGTAGCLRTPKGGSARQIVIVVEKKKIRMRWMNPREYSRLQGAGDFPLVGGVNQQLFGFGDAVCVPAIRWIGERVLNPLAANIEKVTI